MRILILASLFVASAFCQAPATPAPKVEPAAPAPKEQRVRTTRHSFMLVSTRATALFQAAGTIDASLHADGSSLHPATITLRLRIEHTLDQAESAIDKGDLDRADEEIKVAGELVARFARRIGGE